MTDFASSPVLIRTIMDDVRVEQDGDHALINGVPASMTQATTILANSIHYLRDMLGDAVIARMERGEIKAIVHADAHQLGAKAPTNGKPTYILIDAAQFELGAAERARFAAWARGVAQRESERQAAERAHDVANNEGGEGYNPYRSGAAQTYPGAA